MKFNPQSTVYLGLDIRYFLVRREMNISQWTVDCFLASSRLVEMNTQRQFKLSSSVAIAVMDATFTCEGYSESIDGSPSPSKRVEDG